ncbi:hypothetical protein BV22DRAFT_1135516 [Leucogyrophana mollusca]|uniref:Uncharacterized protein n=1 Tax=Leucogyrophana mollusca TaxID=85980 RepID=A0ACB8AWF8_9AGAM|nr:hypothetical protein BV22DRAFT_1135516 [Leucogyrophana mollusca]
MDPQPRSLAYSPQLRGPMAFSSGMGSSSSEGGKDRDGLPPSTERWMWDRMHMLVAGRSASDTEIARSWAEALQKKKVAIKWLMEVDAECAGWEQMTLEKYGQRSVDRFNARYDYGHGSTVAGLFFRTHFDDERFCEALQEALASVGPSRHYDNAVVATSSDTEDSDEDYVGRR